MKPCDPYPESGPRRVRFDWHTAAAMVLAALPFAGYADPAGMPAPALITPAEIVRKALDYSPFLKSQDESVRVAAAQRRQANATGGPQVDARFQALHFNGLENESLGPSLSLPVIQDQYAGSVGVTQPLFTGGRIWNQQRSSRLNETASRSSRCASESDVVLDALAAYWQWSKAIRAVSAMQSAVARMKAHAADMANLRATGMATDSDVLSSDVLLDQTLLKLDDAQRQVDLARTRLAELTGAEPALNLQPEEAAAPPDNDPLALDAAIAAALSNRSELAAARLQADAADAAAAAARADAFPHIAVSARYEQGRPNNRDFPPADEWKSDTYVGASVSWMLLDSGLTRARTAEARARAAQGRIQAQRLQDRIEAEVKQARIALTSARSRTRTAAHAEASARRNVEVATDLWKNGMTRHAEVLDAQASLTDAQSQRIAAQADAAIAEAALRHAMGVLKAP